VSREEVGNRSTGSGGALGRVHSISRWEWITAAAGLLIVLAVVVFMTFEAVAGERTQPAITVRVDSVVAVPGGHAVRFVARNTGDQAGAAVVVEGRLARAGAEPEVSRVTLDYVPGRSERRGGLFFVADPRGGRLELRAVGYVSP
jgi:uncharacterized protein (TIGR02588 family)